MAAVVVELTGDMEKLEPEPPQSSIFPTSVNKEAAQEWVRTRRQQLRPWSEFFRTNRLRAPKSLAPLGGRVIKNLDYFLSNYLSIFIVLIVFCLLTSPLLLIAIGALGGVVYFVRSKIKDSNIKVLNVDLTPTHQYIALGLASFPFLWLVGAGSAVFWILGASFFIIMAHASFYQSQEEVEAFEQIDGVA